jgi:hypothetical protein
MCAPARSWLREWREEDYFKNWSEEGEASRPSPTASFEAYHAAPPPPTCELVVRMRIVAGVNRHLHTVNLVIRIGDYVGFEFRVHRGRRYQLGDSAVDGDRAAVLWRWKTPSSMSV